MREYYDCINRKRIYLLVFWIYQNIREIKGIVFMQTLTTINEKLMKEKLKDKLIKYDYKVLDKGDQLQVKLGHSLEVIIDLSQSGKCIIKENLKSWNFLTGVVEMSLKGAMIYNTIGLIIGTLLFVYIDTVLNLFNLTYFLILVCTWISIWTVFYLIKSENFKRQIIDWIDNS